MANNLHRVKANLYDNPLTVDTDDFVARVISERTLGVADIANSAVSRGGASVSATDMEHNVNLFFKEMAYQLCDGYSVNTGYFSATPLIKGVFNSPDESFDPSKHSVIFQFTQGETMRKELANIEVQIMGVAESGITITQVTDVKSGSVNNVITPNRNLKIKGNKLKLVGDSEGVGVYFTHADTGVATKVDASDIVTNNPSELIVVVPALATGTYKVQVMSQFSGSSKPLKELRSFEFDKLLTVQAP